MHDITGSKSTYTFKSNSDLNTIFNALLPHCKRLLHASFQVLTEQNKTPDKISGIIRGVKISSMAEAKYVLQSKPGGNYELSAYTTDHVSGRGTGTLGPGELFNQALRAMNREGTISGFSAPKRPESASAAEIRQLYNMK